MTGKEDDDRIARLADPDLLAKVRGAVPPDMQPADAKDVVQRVFERLLLLEPLPDTKEGLLGLAVVMTRHEAVDEFRRQGRRARKHVDVEGEGVGEAIAEPSSDDDDAAEQEQLRIMMRAVEGEIAKGRLSEDKRELARMLAEGMTPTQIAKATKRPVGTVKSDVSRLRAHLKKYLYLYAGLTAFVVVFAVLMKRRPEPEVGPDNAAMSATATTAAPAASTGPAPQALRDLALEMCQDGFYREREQRLDEARAADPTSESLPVVKELRATIAKWKAQKDAPQGPIKPDKPSGR